MQDDVPDQPSSPRQNDDRVKSSSADIDDDNRPNELEKDKVQTTPGAEELEDSFDENMPTLQSAAIDCGPERNVESQPSPEHQRPLRRANRPTRFRDAAFDTQFEPKPRRKKCKKIRRPQKTGNYVTNGKEYLCLGRGVDQKPLTGKERNRATITAAQEKATLASSIADLQTQHSALSPNKTSTKTSTHLQERLTADALQFPSTAAGDATINKSITAARPVRASRLKDTAVAAGG